MAALQFLPNEILLAIAGHLADFQDLAALALTGRRLFSVANPGLYATAARDYKTALFYCAENRLIEPIGSLLNHGADPNQIFASPIPPDSLNHVLAAQGRRPGRRPLFDQKLALAVMESTLGRTQHGDDALVTLLLDNGANINSALHATGKFTTPESFPHPHSFASTFYPDPLLATPLHLAILAGHSSTARLLLARGASTIVSYGGITALHVAAWYGNLELCKSLLDESPHQAVDSRTAAQLTPFHYAVAGGQLQTVGRFLLQRGADIRAGFKGPQLDGYIPSYFSYHLNNAFTYALWAQQHGDASILLDMNPDFAASGHISYPHDPLEGCLVSIDINRSGDGEEAVALLRRLLLSSDHGTDTASKSFWYYCTLALSRDLPQFTKLLLESANVRAPPLRNIESGVPTRLIQHARSNAGVDAVMALIEYGVSVQGMTRPCLSRVFPPPTTGPVGNRLPAYHEGMSMPQFEARLKIGKLVYQRLSAGPEGVDDNDLRVALVGACQPGGLRMCEWLASIGALRAVAKADLAIMLYRAASGNDSRLTEWVLGQTENTGDKCWVMNRISVRDVIFKSGGNETALMLARHGANLKLQVEFNDEMPWSLGWTRRLFSCRTRQRMPIHAYYDGKNGSNVFFLVCGKPDIPGAVELLQLAIQAAGESAKDLVNCNLLTSHPYRNLPPVSLLCSARLPWSRPRWDHRATIDRRPEEANAHSEPARLAMLQMLLDAGAEVHTLAERRDYRPAEDSEEPTESLWHALASEDRDEIKRQQAFALERGPSVVWGIYDWGDDPIRCAIRSGFPTLVQAILEARPLPTRNHPAALRYLKAACDGDPDAYHETRRLSPEHNLAEFSKHIILDLNSEAACSPDSFMDFNPFEMGDIKATEGSY
ncbi:uncharacterized protein B0H64DRAFT_464887 [Chaetomium fimeti]|uniref:protein S-acyltransferase n=1 Tax=Chaetomium fimeti TaxID=1854472 RepID=A0AAE0LQB3_9PEZI|nr:hypothetical protein B0H64DRAFT_464887 [Chaetomium fimeti]